MTDTTDTPDTPPFTMPSFASKADLKAYAPRIDSLSPSQKIDLTAYVVAAGLMLPRGFSAKMLWFLCKLGAKLHRSTPQKRYVMALRQRPEDGIELAKDTALQTRDWMIHGKDRTDPRSAGGFNEEEFAKLVLAVEALRSGKIPVA